MGAFTCVPNALKSSAMERDETCAEDQRTLADTELDVVTGGFGGGFGTSFLATVGGHTEATWTPRTYAVQTDLSGGITGAQ
jgi:1,4-dihydroxy-2-naphthoyl-CoA synthase